MKKLFFFFLILIISSSFVFAVPELPVIVSGGVYINEKPAKAGTEITAFVKGEEVSKFEVTEKGKFTLLLQKLNENDNVSFYVDNIYSGESVTYESGGFEQLTLKIEKSYLVYYLGVALILLIGAGFFIWKRKLIQRKKRKLRKG
mgnify:CR=1 FL=1